MTITLTAMLFAVAISCLGWVAGHALQGRRALAMSPSVRQDSLQSLKNSGASLNETASDRLATDLFVAGFREKKHVRNFRLAQRIGAALPLVPLSVSAIQGSLQPKTAMVLVIASLALFVYPRLIVRSMKKKRQNKISRALPQFLDLLVICVESGLGFTAAIERILKELDPGEPLAAEFGQMCHEIASGLPLAEACDRLIRRCDVQDLTLLLNSIIQSDQMGASLTDSLRVQAAEVRDKFRQRMRAQAYQVPVKILLPTVLIFLVIFTMMIMPPLFQVGEMMKENGVGAAAPTKQKAVHHDPRRPKPFAGQQTSRTRP